MPKSVRRTLDILKLLGSQNEKYSIAEISRMSELPPSTVHRLLAVLKDYRFVEQDEYTQEYYLGATLISLGFKARNYIDMRKIALKHLRELSHETDEDSYLAIVDGNTGIFLEHISGPQPLKVMDTMRSSVPLHCGAIRKVLLAFSSDDFISAYIEQGLEKFTDQTLVVPASLKSELATIRNQGYAVSTGEYVTDGSGIGAPVRDSSGEVVASIGIIGPTSRFTDQRIETLVASVTLKAEELSVSLGYFA